MPQLHLVFDLVLVGRLKPHGIRKVNLALGATSRASQQGNPSPAKASVFGYACPVLSQGRRERGSKAPFCGLCRCAHVAAIVGERTCRKPPTGPPLLTTGFSAAAFATNGNFPSPLLAEPTSQ